MTDSYNQENINLFTPAAEVYADAIWIDVDTAIAVIDQTGRMNAPFSTFAAAIAFAIAKQDALPVGTLPTDRGGFIQIFIVAGGIYDEPINILRGNTFYEFLFMGPAVLGDGLGVNRSSTNRRDVKWDNSSAQELVDNGAPGGRRPQLIFAPMFSVGPMSSTHTAIASGFSISGDLIFDTPGGVGDSSSCEVHLSHIKLFGVVEGVTDFGIRNTYIEQSFFDQTYTHANANFNWVQQSEFDGLVTISDFGQINDCDFDGGFTCTGFAALIPPTGFFNCDFAGTFTGPAGSALCDGNTNFFFKASGALLAGGATKVILTDLVP